MACNQHLGSPMGTRKHLNYLIYDYNTKNSPETTKTLDETITDTEPEDFEENVADSTTPKQKPWTMPYWQVSEREEQRISLIQRRELSETNSSI